MVLGDLVEAGRRGVGLRLERWVRRGSGFFCREFLFSSFVRGCSLRVLEIGFEKCSKWFKVGGDLLSERFSRGEALVKVGDTALFSFL